MRLFVLCFLVCGILAAIPGSNAGAQVVIVKATTESASLELDDRDTATTPCLGRLETRDHIITVHADADEVRYTVTNRKGENLGRNLTREQMRQRFPEDYDLLHRGNARQKLDASLGPLGKQRLIPAATPKATK